MSTQRGFTLLELMLALLISTALLALLYQGVSQSLQQWQRSNSIAQHSSQQYRLNQHLRQQLSQALRMKGPDRQLVFQGDDQQLQFVAAIDHPARSGLYHYQLSHHHTQDNQYQFTLKIRRWHPNPTEPAAVERFQLHTGASPVLIEYASQNRDGSLEWHNQWQPQRSLPVLVRLRQQPSPLHAHGWPEQLIEIKSPHHVR